jgi:pantetheine-phosphate adenylyltransferase
MRRKAIYAGSFDPFTKGHMDVVEQALKVFDEVVIGIGVHPKKERTFKPWDSVELILESLRIRNIDLRVTVDHFDNALVDFAAAHRADFIVRGFRQITDFNDEFTQHGVNSRLTDATITYFICHERFLHVSSTTAKELVRLGKPVDWLVDEHVAMALRGKVFSGV